MSLSRLREVVRAYPSALLGYSGGVDSALLAVVLRQELGRNRMLAAIGRSDSYPEVQWRVAHEIALLEWAEHGAFHPLDLQRATATCRVAATHRLLEQLLARLRIVESVPSSITLPSSSHQQQ